MSTSIFAALLSPAASFYLGQHSAPRAAPRTAPRLSPVVATAEKHATVIFLRHVRWLKSSSSLPPEPYFFETKMRRRGEVFVEMPSAAPRQGASAYGAGAALGVALAAAGLGVVAGLARGL